MSADPTSRFAPEPKIQNKDREVSFKQKLDQAAHDARKPDDEPNQNPIIEKGSLFFSVYGSVQLIDVSKQVTQYIPAVANILGHPQEERGEKVSRPGIPGPPERPYDDTQVEEFIRQQHRSKGEDGLLQ